MRTAHMKKDIKLADSKKAYNTTKCVLKINQPRAAVMDDVNCKLLTNPEKVLKRGIE